MKVKLIKIVVCFTIMLSAPMYILIAPVYAFTPSNPTL